MIPKRVLLAIACSISLSSEAMGGEIQERLDTPAAFSFVSKKPPASLVFCIADAISRLGAPAAFDDGPNRIVVTSSSGEKVLVAIDVVAGPTGTAVIGHIQGRNWDDRMRQRVASCL